MVTATELEAAPLSARPPRADGAPGAARSAAHGRPERGDFRILVAGLGEEGTPLLERALQRHRPAALLHFGLAGALDPDLAPGQCVTVRRWLDPSPPHSALESTDPALRRRTGRRAPELCEVDAVTVSSPLHDRSRRDALRRNTGARVVEMEGARWAAVARRAGVPCAALRVVSDRADRRLPLPRHLVLRSDGGVRWGRWILAVVRGDDWRRPAAALADLRAARRDWIAAVEGLRRSATLVQELEAPGP